MRVPKPRLAAAPSTLTVEDRRVHGVAGALDAHHAGDVALVHLQVKSTEAGGRSALAEAAHAARRHGTGRPAARAGRPRRARPPRTVTMPFWPRGLAQLM